MNKFISLSLLLLLTVLFCSCKSMHSKTANDITAEKILGNSKYQAISYGGYRDKTRDVESTVSQLTEDLKILSAMNIKVLRTYNVHHTEAATVIHLDKWNM